MWNVKVKCPLLISDFNRSWNVLAKFYATSQYPVSCKSVQLFSSSLHSSRLIDGQIWFRWYRHFVLDLFVAKCRKLKSFVFFCSNISRYAENCYWLCPPRFVTLVGLLFVTTFRSVIQEFSSLKLSFIKWLVSWNLFHFLIAFPITLLGQFPKRISWQHSIISSSTHYET